MSKKTLESLEDKSKNILTPVSYTHLDVYKRQVFLGFHKEKPRCGVRLILHKGQTLRLEAVRPQHSQHLEMCIRDSARSASPATGWK